MFTLDKLNLADLRLLFLAVNFKVNFAKVCVEKFLSIPPLSRKSTYLELSEQLKVKLNSKHSKFNLTVSCSLKGIGYLRVLFFIIDPRSLKFCMLM